MTAYLALEKLKPKQKLTAPPYNALPGRVADRPAGRREDDGAGPALRPDPRERQRRRRHPRRRACPGRCPTFVDQMNREAAGARASTNTELREPDRPRRRRQLLERRRPGRARAERCSRTRSSPGSPTARAPSCAAAISPRRIDSRNTLLGQRPHAWTASRPATRSTRATSWSARRRATGPSWSRSCSERGSEAGARRRDRGAPRLRLLALQRRAAGDAGRGARRSRSSTTATSALPLVAERGDRGLGPRGPAGRTRWSRRPTRSAATSSEGEALGQRRRHRRRAGSPAARRWWRPSRSRPRPWPTRRSRRSRIR